MVLSSFAVCNEIGNFFCGWIKWSEELVFNDWFIFLFIVCITVHCLNIVFQS